MVGTGVSVAAGVFVGTGVSVGTGVGVGDGVSVGVGVGVRVIVGVKVGIDLLAAARRVSVAAAIADCRPRPDRAAGSEGRLQEQPRIKPRANNPVSNRSGLFCLTDSPRSKDTAIIRGERLNDKPTLQVFLSLFHRMPADQRPNDHEATPHPESHSGRHAQNQGAEQG